MLTTVPPILSNATPADTHKGYRFDSQCLSPRAVTHQQRENLLLPADGALARDDVALAIIEAEVLVHLADALTWQAVHAHVTGSAHAFHLARPLIHHAFGKLVACLEFAWVRLVTCRENKQKVLHYGRISLVPVTWKESIKEE